MAQKLKTLLRDLSDAKHPEGAALELELRFFIDNRKKQMVHTRMFDKEKTIDIAKKLIGKYSAVSSRTEQSINFIRGNRQTQMTFTNGVQHPERLHYAKDQIIKPIALTHDTLPGYRMSIVYEVPTTPVDIGSAELARVRLRHSADVSDNWRLDITLIKTVTNFSVPAELKSVKTAMLFEMKDFVRDAPWDYAEMIEIELEHRGGEIKLEHLKFADELFTGTGAGDSGGEKEGESGSGSNIVYQDAIYDLARYIKPRIANKFRKEFGMKQLSNQVIELNKNMYLKELYGRLQDYYVTDKVDGKRAIVHLGPKSYAVSDSVAMMSGINLPAVTIIDTEQYSASTSGSASGETSYYIFDVIVFEGKSLMSEPFEERLKYFDRAVALAPMLRLKPFKRLTNKYADELREFKANKKPYEVDGVILTPATGLYDTMQVYKYKPVDKLTVDFLIKKCPARLLGIKPYVSSKNLYILFCGVSRAVYFKLRLKLLKYYEDIFKDIDARNLPHYFPYQFQPSDNAYAYLFHSDRTDLDGEVGEFLYKNGAWHMDRIREDRRIEVQRGNYFGNNYKIAELTWMAYADPLVIEDEGKTSGDGTVYFQEHDSTRHKASRNYNSCVKSDIFKNMGSPDWVMDLASGKGQDLFRYAQAGVKNLVCLEIDTTALMELITRKHEFASRRDNHGQGNMSVHVHAMDLTAPTDTNLAALKDLQIPGSGLASMDTIVCNFAFHYFLKNKETLAHVAAFINKCLKPGGRFIFTAFDGKAVVRLLNEHKGEWTVRADSGGDSGGALYSIKRQYSVSYIEAIGQKIDVLLPFSGDTYYTEYLVNIDTVKAAFEKHKFVLEIDQSFSKYADICSSVPMTDADRTYTGLYHHYCLFKR